MTSNENDKLKKELSELDVNYRDKSNSLDESMQTIKINNEKYSLNWDQALKANLKLKKQI